MSEKELMCSRAHIQTLDMHSKHRKIASCFFEVFSLAFPRAYESFPSVRFICGASNGSDTHIHTQART